MKPLLSAPFVSLFLILAVIVAATARTPKGLPVGIVHRLRDCGERRSSFPRGIEVIAHVRQNGSVRLNLEEAITRNVLAKRLHELFRTRTERVLFLKADPDLPFQSVAEIIDIAQSEVDYVGILTPAVEKETFVCLSMDLSMNLPAVMNDHHEPTVKLKDVPMWPWR